MEVCGEQAHRIISGQEDFWMELYELEGRAVLNGCYPYNERGIRTVPGAGYGIFDMLYEAPDKSAEDI